MTDAPKDSQRFPWWLLLIVAPFVYFAFIDTPTETSEGDSNGERVLSRAKIKVEITENLDGKATEINISDLILRRTLALHGFELVEEGHEYLLSGELNCDFFQDLTFDFQGSSQHLEYQYHARFSGGIRDAQGREIQDLSFPEPMMNGRTDLALAQRDIRRRAATLIGSRTVGGATLGNVQIKGLLDALTDSLDGRKWNVIVGELTAAGAPAVPYLLDALGDERSIQLPGSYPGFEDLKVGDLKIYHAADLALRDILDRDSFLDPDSTEDYLHRVRTAWLWVWEDMQSLPETLRVRSADREKSIPAAQG